VATLPSLGKHATLVKLGVGAVATVLVALAYFVVFYGDVSDAITAQHQQEVSLRKDLADATQSEFAYHKDLAELAERQQRQRELNRVLPDTTEYPAFLSAVQAVANVSGVSLQGWSPLDEVAQKFYARVPMRLTLLGKFHQVAKFFYGVGHLDRIINIENITLGTPKVTADEVELKVDCLATAFHTVAPTPAGGAAPATAARP
jgi:type IV pilus assembly protein PilO